MYGATDNQGSANNSRAVSLNTQLDDEAPLLAAPHQHDEHFMPVNICWEGVNYTVSGIGGVKRTLLQNVSGYCMPGETLAIMGPSGSGKTTLLNIISKRRMKSKELEGDIMVNGHKVTKPTKKIFKRISGYVMQEDFLIGTLTVKETLVNAALLRLPKNMTYEDKMKRVDRALEVLGLRHIQDNRIGTQMARGVSGGERRRVSIAVELISSPPIMFLDEPTSGLDSKNSQSVCDTLMELKRRRHTVIFTIHQPRSHIFAEFDKLLLLARGKVVYFGSASNALTYFSKLGHSVPLQENPADFLVDLVTIDLRDQDEVKKLEDFTNHYSESQECTATKEKVIELSSVSGGKRDSMRKENKRASFIEHLKEEEALITEFREATGAPHADEKPNPFTQFRVLLKRNFVTVTRDRSRLFGRVVVSIFQGVMVGTTFFQLSTDQDQVVDRVNDLFFVCTFFFLLSYTILPRIIADRVLFLRERANGMYGTWPYFLAGTLASLPLCFLPSFAYSSLVAFLSNLQTSADRFLFWIFLTFLHAFCGESLIQFCSCISRSYDIAYAIVGAIFQVFLFFGGFAVAYENILTMWKWAYWVSCYQYAFSGVMINEFDGREFSCGDTDPSQCYFTDGEKVLEYYDLEDRSKWSCFWAVVGFIGLYRFLAYLALRFLVKERV